MATNRDQFTTEIYVNQEQANDAMEKLRTKVEKTAKAYEKLLNTKDADQKKTEKARKAWEDARRSLDNVEKGVDTYSRALKNLTGQSMDNLLKMQRQINSELKKTKPNTPEWHKLSKEYALVTNRLKDMRKAQDDVTQRSAGMKGMLEKISGIGNKVGITLMAIPTAIKGITSALGGVIKVTRQVITASQSMGDKWNNGMSAMKTTTEAFFMSLSTGDWTAFNNGISEALAKARELAELKDVLGSFQIAGGYVQARYRTDFTSQMAEATNTENTPEDRKRALEQAKADLDAQREFTEREAAATFQALQKMFEAWKGITFSSQEEFDSFFDRLFRYTTTGADQAVQEIVALKGEVEKYIQQVNNIARSGAVPQELLSNLENAQNAYNTAVANATKETLNLVAAADLNDEKHRELIDTYAKWRSDLQRIAQDEKSFNRTRDRVVKQIEKVTDAVNEEAEAEKKRKEAEEAKEKSYQAATQRLQQRQQQQVNIWKKQYADGLVEKERYEMEVSRIEEDFIGQRIRLSQLYAKNVDALMGQLLDRQIARAEKAKAILKEEADAVLQYYEELNLRDEALFSGGGQTNQQTVSDFYEKIWKKAADIRASITEDSARSQYETEMAWAEKLAEQGMITTEEAEKYKLKIKSDYAAEAAGMVASAAEKASDFVNMLREYETEKLEAEYQAQLTAAGDNTEKREQIEQQYEQKKLDISKKYADVDMGINIAKTVANGAVAIMKAFADLGPVGGAIAAALIGVTTGVEIATIVAQRNAIKATSLSSPTASGSSSVGQRVVTGYKTGGYTTSSANDNQVVGVAHANEWYAPAWMVRQNPVVFANLERYRREGSASHSVTRQGFAAGGYTGQAPSENSGLVPASDIEAAVESAIRRAMASGAIRAYLVRNDLTELDAQTLRFNSITARK